jgi:tetratricopeptide (TPR) repeat protein
MNADRARECLDLVNPILELSGRDPMLLLRAARAEARVGDGVRCDSLLEEASQHADQLPGDERAEIWFWQAERLISRGDSDMALNLFEGSLIPLFKELNQTRELAITMGKIADIRQARGELDEALRIRMQEQLPVYERLGDVREKAITMGQIADIRQARGELDEALRIRMQEVLPVFERLGDVRSKAITMGQIADIRQARGELDEALRIRMQEQLPVYERLGLVREVIVGRVNIALVLAQRGRAEDVAQVVELLFTSLAEAKRYGFAEAEQIEAIIQQIMGK